MIGERKNLTRCSDHTNVLPIGDHGARRIVEDCVICFILTARFIQRENMLLLCGVRELEQFLKEGQ